MKKNKGTPAPLNRLMLFRLTYVSEGNFLFLQRKTGILGAGSRNIGAPGGDVRHLKVTAD
jgi:hypothetical protein